MAGSNGNAATLDACGKGPHRRDMTETTSDSTDFSEHDPVDPAELTGLAKKKEQGPSPEQPDLKLVQSM